MADGFEISLSASRADSERLTAPQQLSFCGLELRSSCRCSVFWSIRGDAAVNLAASAVNTCSCQSLYSQNSSSSALSSLTNLNISRQPPMLLSPPRPRPPSLLLPRERPKVPQRLHPAPKGRPKLRPPTPVMSPYSLKYSRGWLWRCAASLVLVSCTCGE